MDLPDIYRTFHPKIARDTFFSSVHGTLARIDHMLGHKASLSKFKKTENVSNIFSAAAAAKSLQSCPTLCDPIDGSPPASPVPGILQARILK